MKEIVIKIDDRIHYGIINSFTVNGSEASRIVLEAVKNGKVLPKGHGRLIDADTLADGFEDNYEFCEALNATPTLVEADKGEE